MNHVFVARKYERKQRRGDNMRDDNWQQSEMQRLDKSWQVLHSTLSRAGSALNVLSRRLRTNKRDNGWNAVIFFSRANSLISKRLNKKFLEKCLSWKILFKKNGWKYFTFRSLSSVNFVSARFFGEINKENQFFLFFY